jgi:hypothetical protein
MYYHIQLVNFVTFFTFLIRPNVYIFAAPLYCFLSPHFIQIRPNVERRTITQQIRNLSKYYLFYLHKPVLGAVLNLLRGESVCSVLKASLWLWDKSAVPLLCVFFQVRVGILCHEFIHHIPSFLLCMINRS